MMKALFTLGTISLGIIGIGTLIYNTGKKVRRRACCSTIFDSLQKGHTCKLENEIQTVVTSIPAFTQLRDATISVAADKSLEIVLKMNQNCEFYSLLQPQKPISLPNHMIVKLAQDIGSFDWFQLCNTFIVTTIFAAQTPRWYTRYKALFYSAYYSFCNYLCFGYVTCGISSIRSAQTLNYVLEQKPHLVNLFAAEARVYYLVQSILAQTVQSKAEYLAMLDVLDSRFAYDQKYNQLWGQMVVVLIISQYFVKPTLMGTAKLAKWVLQNRYGINALHPFDLLPDLDRTTRLRLIDEVKSCDCVWSVIPTHYWHYYYGEVELHSLSYYACRIDEIQQLVIYKCEKGFANDPQSLWFITCERKEKFELESEVIAAVEKTKFVHNSLIYDPRTEQEHLLAQSCMFKQTFDTFPLLLETKQIKQIEKKAFCKYMASQTAYCEDNWRVIADYFF